MTTPRFTLVTDGASDGALLLHELLVAASELSGRRRKTFKPRARVRRVAQYLEDFSPLRGLSAFQALENEVKEIAGSVV